MRTSIPYPLRQYAWITILAILLSHVSAASVTLARRDEPVGASCSPEGQWNCMPDTWQRCASGQWSRVMDLAQGTVCTPGGLTEEIRIEHDGSVNGEGGPGRSGGPRNGNGFTGGAWGSVVTTYLPLSAFAVWVHSMVLY